MKVTIEPVNAVTRKINVCIPREQVASELDRAYKNLQREVRMHGFRPGRVPRSVLQSRFGTKVNSEVQGKLISESLENTLEKEKLDVVSQPTVEPGRLEPKADYEYSATVEIKPEVVAKDYTGLAVEREIYAMDEKEVEAKLTSLREQRMELVEVEEARPLQEGDVARIEYKMKVDGAFVDKGQARNSHVLVQPDNDLFLPGFTAKMVGMERGESRDIHLSIPADHSQVELAGKEVDISVVLHDIKRKEIPELDDEFAKDLEYDSLEALTAKIREDLTVHLKEVSDIKLRRNIAERLIEKHELELPPGLVNQQVDQLIEEQYRQMGRKVPAGGLSIPEERRAILTKEAEFRLRTSLILESIAQQEDITATDEDVNQKIEELAKQANQSPAAIKGWYVKNNMLDRVMLQVAEEKTFALIAEKAEITEVEKDSHEHGLEI